MENSIEITGVDASKFVRECYNLSKPQGLGMLHYKEGELSDSEVENILADVNVVGRVLLSMDYVKGRAVKMTVWREREKLFIRDTWYDHTQEQLDELLKRCGVRA